MIRPTMEIRTFLFAAGLMIAIADVRVQSAILTSPRMGQSSGTFLPTGDTKLCTNPKGERKKMLMDYLKTLFIHFKDNKKQTEDNMVSLMITRANPQLSSPESYTLEVTPHKITVQATFDAGLLYGVQTLLQMAQPAMEGTWSAQTITIQDSPRFKYRELMFNVSRHFHSKELVRKQIDTSTYHKLNRLHLCFTDVAGWRIEIKKYPLLMELAAWHPEVNWKRWWNEGGRKYCRLDTSGASGGYYAQGDTRELVNCARERHITTIPEVEMPTHSEEVLIAYPELSCSGEPYKNADLCVGNEKIFTFPEDVLTEVMKLFPSRYIHVGGDKVERAIWKTYPKCQKRMKGEQLDNVDELQSYLIHRVEVFPSAHGRKLPG